MSKPQEKTTNKENLDPVSQNIVEDRIEATSRNSHCMHMQIFLSVLIRLTGFHLDAFDMPRLLAAGAKRMTDKGKIKRVFAPDAQIARAPD